MDIGLLSAFVGGVLALLSPCGALLLPAFFASTVGSGPRLWLHALVFYLGLLVVLVPLGLGAGAIGLAFVEHRHAVIVGASVLLVVLGAAQVLGFGFDPARFLPGMDSLRDQAAERTGLVKTVLLGATSGVAGFCAGPVLGAVLTLAAARGELPAAGTLLAVYGAGMVAPLLLLATVWGRIGTRTRAALRGRTVVVLGRPLHSTSMITGLLVMAVGVLFWTTNGLVDLPGPVSPETSAAMQDRVRGWSGPVVDSVVIVGVAASVLVLWNRTRGRNRRAESAEGDARAGEPSG